MNTGCDGRTVLIVDDDEFISGAIMNLLQLDGYRVLHAHNGRQALTVLKGITPCLILLDMQMPIMDGDQFLDHVQQDKKLNTIPIIVVSAVSSAAHVKKKGARAYFNKSVDLPQLLKTVKDYCTGSSEN